MIGEAIEAPNELGLNYVPDFTLFEHLKVYARGFTTLTRSSRSLKTKFRKRTAVLDAYQRLIVVLKFNEGIDHRAARPERRGVSTDVQRCPPRRYGDAPARTGNSRQDAAGR